MRDLNNNLAIVNLADPTDLVYTDTNSKYVDIAGYRGAAIVVHVGALTGVDGSNYLTPVLQESDEELDSKFSDVAAADIIGGFTKIDSTSEDSVVQVAGYIGDKRYIRAKLDYTGSTISAGIVGVIGILGLPDSAPVSTAPTPRLAT